MDADRLAELERALLLAPFDATLRSDYAGALRAAGRNEDALAQFELLFQQSDVSVEHLLDAADCARRLGRTDAAARFVDLAESEPGFDRDDARVLLVRAGGTPSPRNDAPSSEASGASEVSEASEASEPRRSSELREAPIDAAPSDETHDEIEPGRERVALHSIAGGRESIPSEGELISISRAETVRFADVVGMTDLKKTIRLRIIEPFVRPGLFQRFRKKSGGGVLLYGPPGCGKTMIARAIATECEANFTPIGISDILNMWIGESERNLAAVFEKARDEAPSVLFFDELDALAFSRSKARSDHTRSLVNELLNQLDGMTGDNDRVLILAATNMPWDVDDAMKRPGRLDRQIFVPPPDDEARSEMLEVKLRDVPTDAIDTAAIARSCNHFSGADIDGVIERAKEEVIAEILDGAEERPIRTTDLLTAAESTDASTVEWLKTARNLVKFGAAGATYKDVEKYLRKAGLY